ncbi:PLP-dependent aminotransferase family protein [Stappia sp.]|uniref:MocR-like pyridoxine biosynthesis transcription factor PdxR n=1 Tax=Stappia sp. TaxID=1870903 RepID=UPI003A990718
MLEGLLILNRGSAVPLPEQIYRGVRAAISDGRLALGGRLPSSRALAASLSVSRNTVNAAYELLVAEGVVSVRKGAAPRILDEKRLPPRFGGTQAGSAPAPSAGLSARGLAMAVDHWGATERKRGGKLEPGTPGLDCFPQDEWARTLRRATRGLRGGALFYDEIAGYGQLRQALARYLVEERGLRASPERIIVTPSTQASLFLLASILADPGDTVWLEDPGYLGARAAFLAAGLSVRPMPVDADGADPSVMPLDPPPRLIYVTPSHQYPFGVRMPLERRLMVLERARACGGLVVEDDYDSEFLFAGRPLAALQGLGHDGQTVYLGTFSKAMLPGLRCAYMVVPEDLAPALARTLRVTGHFANVATQAALADFIESGRYRAHLRRIRETYEERGCALAAALRSRLGNAVGLSDPVGGVQCAVRFNMPCNDKAVAAAANRRGFGVAALSAYALEADVCGLVVGFANAREGDAEACAIAIAEALAETGGQEAYAPPLDEMTGRGCRVA